MTSILFWSSDSPMIPGIRGNVCNFGIWRKQVFWNINVTSRIAKNDFKLDIKKIEVRRKKYWIVEGKKYFFNCNTQNCPRWVSVGTVLHGNNVCLVLLLHSALKKLSEQFWHKIILLVPLILTYLLSGPQVIRKEIQQQKCKDLETPPEGPHTAFRERLRPLSRP